MKLLRTRSPSLDGRDLDYISHPNLSHISKRNPQNCTPINMKCTCIILRCKRPSLPENLLALKSPLWTAMVDANLPLLCRSHIIFKLTHSNLSATGMSIQLFLMTNVLPATCLTVWSARICSPGGWFYWVASSIILPCQQKLGGGEALCLLRVMNEKKTSNECSKDAKHVTSSHDALSKYKMLRCGHLTFCGALLNVLEEE